MFVFVLFEKNTENEVCVRERHFHWWARDREVARIAESRGSVRGQVNALNSDKEIGHVDPRAKAF